MEHGLKSEEKVLYKNMGLKVRRKYYIRNMEHGLKSEEKILYKNMGLNVRRKYYIRTWA